MRVTPQLSKAIKDCLASWYWIYADRDGNLYKSAKLSDIKAELSRMGWRGLSRLDESDLQAAGFTIIEGTYTQGSKPTGRWVKVVVLEPHVKTG